MASGLAAALAIAGATACSGKRHRPKATPMAAESSPPPEPLTPEVARRAFGAFVSNDDVARASGDERLALWWTRDGQTQLTAAAFRKAMAAGEPVPRYRYEQPVFYVPRLRPKGTQWFVVRAKRTMLDGKDARTVMLGFVRTKPTEHWMLSLSTTLGKKQKPPEIVVDAQGYAEPLATFADTLVIQPRLVSAIQSTLAEEGPHNVAAKVMETGQYTTGFYASDAKITKRKKGSGLRYTVVYTAVGYPIFPLRTVDGGGVVLYALGRDAVTARLKKKDTPSRAPEAKQSRTPTPGATPAPEPSGASPSPPRKAASTKVPIPEDAAALIDPAKVRDVIDVSEMQQYVALVPARPKSRSETQDKARVIGFDGGTVKASVPTK